MLIIPKIPAKVPLVLHLPSPRRTSPLLQELLALSQFLAVARKLTVARTLIATRILIVARHSLVLTLLRTCIVKNQISRLRIIATVTTTRKTRCRKPKKGSLKLTIRSTSHLCAIEMICPHLRCPPSFFRFRMPVSHVSLLQVTPPIWRGVKSRISMWTQKAACQLT